MPKGTVLTPEQQQARREAIVDTALQLMMKQGYGNTSMREIAAALQMGKSSLYDFFATKDEIMVFAVEQQTQESILKIKRIVATVTGAEARLRQIMQVHLETPPEYRAASMWLTAAGANLAPEYRQRLQLARHAYQDCIKSVIEAGIADGELVSVDAGLMVRLLLNSVLAISYTSRPEGSSQQMLDQTMAIFLHGITKGD